MQGSRRQTELNGSEPPAETCTDGNASAFLFSVFAFLTLLTGGSSGLAVQTPAWRSLPSLRRLRDADAGPSRLPSVRRCCGGLWRRCCCSCCSRIRPRFQQIYASEMIQLCVFQQTWSLFLSHGAARGHVWTFRWQEGGWRTAGRCRDDASLSVHPPSVGGFLGGFTCSC